MRPQLSIKPLMKYLHASATSPARVGGAARALGANHGSEYSPARDFWRGMRCALPKDRRTTRDGQALRAASQNVRDPKKKPLYAAMAQAWPGVASRWEGHRHLPIQGRTITVGGLDIRVAPSFAEVAPNGTTEVVMVSFVEQKIDDTAIDATLRLMQRAFPGAECVYVDLRRPELIRTSHGRRLEQLDGWIESSTLYLAQVLTEAA
jgi:hypothetical protein